MEADPQQQRQVNMQKEYEPYVSREALVPNPTGGDPILLPRYRYDVGRPVVLTGENGSGKSTVLDWMARNPRYFGFGPAEGTQEEEGEDGPNERVGPAVIMADQMYDELIYRYRKVWWNVGLPEIVRGGKTRFRILRSALRQMRALRLNVDPRRYPSDLSGGEKHLLVLARVFQTRASVVLLDEPLAAIDRDRGKIVADRIALEATRRVVVVASHRMWKDQLMNTHAFPGIDGKPLRLSALAN